MVKKGTKKKSVAKKEEKKSAPVAQVQGFVGMKDPNEKPGNDIPAAEKKMDEIKLPKKK